MNRQVQRCIGLVGVGYWGKNVLRVLTQLEVLRMVCDTNPETLEALRTATSGVTYTASYADVLASKHVTAVVIATPAVTHYTMVREALLAHKDVFVEKPLACTAAEGEELVQLARTHKRLLMVGHILHYHPAVKALKQLIAQGELGKIRYIYSNRLNIGKLRTEENILWSFAPHDVSVILSLLGEEPVQVTAAGGAYVNTGIADTTLTMLEFSGGVKAHVFVSWLHPYKEQKIIVVGSKSMAVFDDLAQEKLVCYPHSIEWQNGKIPVAHKAAYRPVPVEAAEPLRIELEQFLSCVRTRTAPPTDGCEALRVLRVLERAERALARHGAQSLSTVSAGYYAHESAYIDANVAIGPGTKIWHFAHILSGSSIGRSCVIGQNVMIGPQVHIGDGCKIQNNVSVYKGITLEPNVFCGPSCVFTNVINPRSAVARMDECKPTLVKQGTTIGANATIVCGHTLGRYCFIGAGAVVTKDVPDYALVMGNPARVHGWMCACGIKLLFKKSRGRVHRAQCPACGKKYEQHALLVREVSSLSAAKEHI